MSSNTVDGEVYSIQHYVIKVVNDLRQVCGFLRILRFPPPIKLTAMISQQYCWKWRLTPGNQTKPCYTYFRKMSIQGSSLDNFQIHSINYCLVSYFNGIEIAILNFKSWCRHSSFDRLNYMLIADDDDSLPLQCKAIIKANGYFRGKVVFSEILSK